MTNRENYLGIARRQGYEYMPVQFSMCPHLRERFNRYLQEHELFIPEGPAHIAAPAMICAQQEEFRPYYAHMALKDGTTIDHWGVAHEPGSEAAFHMTRMRHPMETFDSLEQIRAYPFPRFSPENAATLKERVDAYRGIAS